jgi:signal peptidase II
VSIHRLGQSTISFVVAALVVAADASSKVWARSSLAAADRHVVGPLWFRLSFNRGFSFSLSHTLPTLVTIAELAALAAVAVASGFVAGRVSATGFGLIIGGGVGNLVDRLGSSRHAVTDFVSVGSFPVFNVADSAITVGVLVLIFLTVSGRPLWRAR